MSANPQAATRLRATLVAHRVLPDRDEHLAAIERWLGPFLDRIDDRAERKIVRSFVTWHLRQADAQQAGQKGRRG